MFSYRVILPFLVCGVLASANVVELTEESLLVTLEGAQELLQQEFPGNADFVSQVDELIERSRQLESFHYTVEEKQKEVDRLVLLANVSQLQNLADRLGETLDKEIKLRNAVPVDSEVVTVDDTNVIATIPMSDLKRRFNTKQFMGESETELKAWVLQIVEEELAAYKEDVLAEKGGNKECPSASDIVQDVQVALTEFSQDGIGLIDHAQGGEIVHSMTSPTYTPHPDSSSMLGNVWWRKYIPEDWERLLPTGWKNWNVAIPPYVYHSLVRLIMEIPCQILLAFCICVFSYHPFHPS
jgi:hypothetical protein